MLGRLPLLTGLWLVLAALNAPVQAKELACTSQSGGYVYCRADTSRGVTLIEQIGPFACNKGNTWDFDKNGIWVANGCKARFLLGPTATPDDIEAKAQGSGAESLARDITSGARAARKKSAVVPAAAAKSESPTTQQIATQPQSAEPLALGQAAILVCESKQYKLQKCPVPVKAHVALKRKLGRAECRFNATWGYNYGEIWVSDGCRAEFSVY